MSDTLIYGAFHKLNILYHKSNDLYFRGIFDVSTLRKGTYTKSKGKINLRRAVKSLLPVMTKQSPQWLLESL